MAQSYTCTVFLEVNHTKLNKMYCLVRFTSKLETEIIAEDPCVSFPIISGSNPNHGQSNNHGCLPEQVILVLEWEGRGQERGIKRVGVGGKRAGVGECAGGGQSQFWANSAYADQRGLASVI